MALTLPGHEAIGKAAQSHAIVLADMVVKCLVIHVPEVTEWTDHQCDLVLPVGAVMHAACQCPLPVQALQSHEAGSAEAIGIIISDGVASESVDPDHNPLHGCHLIVMPLTAGCSWKVPVPAIIIQFGVNLVTPQELTAFVLVKHDLFGDPSTSSYLVQIF